LAQDSRSATKRSQSETHQLPFQRFKRAMSKLAAQIVVALALATQSADAAVTCAAGYTIQAGKDNSFCASDSASCMTDPTCCKAPKTCKSEAASISCDAGKANKKDTTTTDNMDAAATKTACCSAKATCAAAACPAGYEKNSANNAQVCPGVAATTCLTTTGDKACCKIKSGTCLAWTGVGVQNNCGAGKHHLDAAKVGDTADKCCATDVMATCAAAACPAGYEKNSDNNLQVCPGVAATTCLTTTGVKPCCKVKSGTCKEWSLVNGNSCESGNHSVAPATIGADTDTCCAPDVMCNTHACPATHKLIADAATTKCAMGSCSNAACCTATCAAASCPAGYEKNSDNNLQVCQGVAATTCLTTTGVKPCCKVKSGTCKEWSLVNGNTCESGNHSVAPDTIGADADTCCAPDVMCDTHACPAATHHKLIADAATTKCAMGSCSNAACCTATCASSYICPAAYEKNSDNNLQACPGDAATTCSKTTGAKACCKVKAGTCKAWTNVVVGILHTCTGAKKQNVDPGTTGATADKCCTAEVMCDTHTTCPSTHELIADKATTKCAMGSCSNDKCCKGKATTCGGTTVTCGANKYKDTGKNSVVFESDKVAGCCSARSQCKDSATVVASSSTVAAPTFLAMVGILVYSAAK